MKTPFDPIPEVIAEIRRGRMVIVTDDADRENEGDLVMAAAKVTPAAINFMAQFGRGLICAPVTEERAASLGLQRMVAKNSEFFKTDFTVSVDAAKGVTTGISVKDRAATIRLLATPSGAALGPRSTGACLPLQAKAGGVLRRAGHTEAAIDLARLAGLDASGVICEIMKEDGSMARLPDLVRFKRSTALKCAPFRIRSPTGARARSSSSTRRQSTCPLTTGISTFISTAPSLMACTTSRWSRGRFPPPSQHW
jgi:3,4-dihydroxy 2-butanone 4-phosphate synthase/GTP cyclohydrolase II